VEGMNETYLRGPCTKVGPAMLRFAECLRVPPECLGTAQGGAANVVPRDLPGRVPLPGAGTYTGPLLSSTSALSVG